MKTMINLLLAVFLVGCEPTVLPIDLAGKPWHDGYYPTWDGSTGCEAFPVSESDVAMSVSGNVLTLTANDDERAGAYVGAIAAKTYPFTDDRTYTLTGQFRKGPGNPEQIDANIQWVDENYVEHFAEILWTLNPYSPLYGWVWTRNAHDGTYVKLYELGDDTDWHTFKIVSFHSGDIHTIKNITIDGHSFDVNLPEGTMQKTYNNRLTVLLEVQNMYPNCSGLITTVGVSEFRNVYLKIEKLP
jgi:hypothetical protein